MKHLRILILGLLALAALLVLLTRGGEVNAHIPPFAPTYGVTLSTTTAGSPAAVIVTYDWDTDRDGLTLLWPSDWGVADGTSIAIGTAVGSFSATLTVGILNGPCSVPIPIGPLTLINASVDTSDVIVAEPGLTNLVVDVDPANGIPDGADHYPDFLLPALPPGLSPLARMYGQAVVLGTNFGLNITFHDPSKWLHDTAMPIIRKIGGIITDVCGEESETTFAANIGTNPAIAGTKIFGAGSTTPRDADNDGIDNTNDTCPFVPNLGDPDGDGIDSPCDPNPFVNDGPDLDGDGFLNAGDNCPLLFNSPQLDSDTDGIGDACDANPTVPDGHLHEVDLVAPVCIIGESVEDVDGDGFCDADEIALSSDPAAASSTPGDLSIRTTCSDGVENDGDGLVDLDDPGCQLPDHDIAIRKINGDAVAGGTSECQPLAPTGCGYNIILRNNTSAVEQGQLGVLVAPIFGAGCSGPEVVLHGGSAQPELAAGSGPINIDGDTDAEFLLTVDVTIPANGQATVNVGVVYPTCAPRAVPGTPADYIILADLCHADDIGPLGLFASAVCGGSADGGQDRVNPANDAPVIRVINDVNR